MSEYIYAMLNRPAIKAAPPGWRFAVSEKGGFSYIPVAYDHPLSISETYRCEMALLSPLPDMPVFPVGTKVRRLKDGKVFEVTCTEFSDGVEYWIGDDVLRTERNWRAVRMWHQYEPLAEQNVQNVQTKERGAPKQEVPAAAVEDGTLPPPIARYTNEEAKTILNAIISIQQLEPISMVVHHPELRSHEAYLGGGDNLVLDEESDCVVLYRFGCNGAAEYLTASVAPDNLRVSASQANTWMRYAINESGFLFYYYHETGDLPLGIMGYHVYIMRSGLWFVIEATCTNARVFKVRRGRDGEPYVQDTYQL